MRSQILRIDIKHTLIMKNETDKEQLLTWYLLGNLPEKERLQVERKFLSDDQGYERILALEDELYFNYALNKLSPGEREQFEKRFLSSKQNQKRAILYSDIVNKISESAPVETVEKNIADCALNWPRQPGTQLRSADFNPKC